MSDISEIKDNLNLRDKTIENLKRAKAEFNKNNILDINKKYNDKDIHFVTIEDENYPLRLRNIYDPPYILYYRGILPEYHTLSVGIVGARMCDEYGRTMAIKISRSLSKAGVFIISGMAYGIDSAAHWGSVMENKKTFAVLGCGVDVVYPEKNRNLYNEILKNNGGIISEFPPGTKPENYMFPMRNRIISGLSDKLIVVEAKKKSGSLITADQAMEQGRDVYAIPGRMDDVMNAGCNELIRQGAGIITSLDDMMEEFGLDKKLGVSEKNMGLKSLTKEEREVYESIDVKSVALDCIVTRSKYDKQVVLAALVSLIRQDFIEETFKNYYRKKFT